LSILPRRFPGQADRDDVDIVFEQGSHEVDLGLAIGAQVLGQLQLEAPLLGRDEVRVARILILDCRGRPGQKLSRNSAGPTRRIALKLALNVGESFAETTASLWAEEASRFSSRALLHERRIFAAGYELRADRVRQGRAIVTRLSYRSSLTLPLTAGEKGSARTAPPG
jgi:hypothetical protein